MNMICVLKDELRTVNDPRVKGRTTHLLIDIIVIGILAVICHAETWEEMEDFALSRTDWLKQFLELPGGIPSHDTLGRVFSIIEPKELEKSFISWVKRVQAERTTNRKDTISLDGKSVRGTIKSNYGQGRSFLHVVSAFSTAQGLVLGQVKAKGRGNAEVSAALELIEILDIEKMVITADAGIGKVSVIEKIIDKKADYVFPIKSNSRSHYDKVVNIFESHSLKDVEEITIKNEGHGRKESRSVTVIRRDNFPKNFIT